MTTHVTISPYGTWTSPLTPEKTTQGAPAIIQMLVDGEETYLCEVRPKNKGRSTLVHCDQRGKCTDVTPPEFNIRSGVHEYGGAPFAVSNGTIYACNAVNHALYRIAPGQQPHQITQGQKKEEKGHKWTGVRYADLSIGFQGIIAVGERHFPDRLPDNYLALINTETGKETVLASGHDFYSSPTLSPDGTKIAWICWNHPDMPWTHTELWLADFMENGALQNAKKISGDFPESVMQPQWSPEGILYFISDRDKGWWNIHNYVEGFINNVCPMDAETGDPAWILGKSSYAFLGSGEESKIIFSYQREAEFNLGVVDPKSKMWQKIPRLVTNIQQLRTGNRWVQFLESYSDREPALMRLEGLSMNEAKPSENVSKEEAADDSDTIAAEEKSQEKAPAKPPSYPIREIRSQPAVIGPEYISKPTHYAFPSVGRIAYGFFYPPYNKYFKAPSGEKPPLIIMIHGGPTSQARGDFSLAKQFWTSRGFAIFDVNYAGSTGYGRSYRQLLNRKWGVFDVEDCVEGAAWLVKQGLVDSHRLFIRGGSAGGYTTLAALASRAIFRGAANYYGVADITALAADTHKFESRYMEQLVGKYPEEKQIWEERSPIHAVDKIKTPLIIFQGENDAVVPKSQSIQIYEALKQKNIPVELHIYPEEEHGFRQAANLIDSLQREAAFYQTLCK